MQQSREVTPPLSGSRTKGRRPLELESAGNIVKREEFERTTP